MLPDDTSSSIAVSGTFLPPDDIGSSPTVDYELGGVAISDASQGLQVQTWTAFVGTSGLDVILQAGNGAPQTIFTAPVPVEQMTFCFDQNMRPAFAYQDVNLTLYLRWYDSLAQDYVTVNFGIVRSPRLCLDDKRPETLERSDIILAFIRGGDLVYRQQRDRFLIERVLRSNVPRDLRLGSIGMTRSLRLQFELG